MDSIHSNKSGHYFDNDKGSYNNAHPDADDTEKVKALLNNTEQILY